MMTRPLSDEDASPSNASPDQPAMKKMKVDMPEDDSVIVKEVVPGATTETPSVAPANAPVQPPAHVAPKPKSNLPTEKDMHISSYISAHIPGFHGIIKHRFSDFMVNEVDLNGKVTHLINLEPPASVIASEKPKTVDDDEAGLSELSQLLNDPDLIESLKEVLSTGTLPEGGLTTEPITDKESRKKVHEIVKLYFSKALSTTTSAESGIKFQRPTKRDNQRSVKPQWSELGGEYLHFTLYKENKDTMEAVDLVSKHIRGSSKTFGFAGTKDKRGITSQRVSGLRVSATQLANLNARLNGVKTGDYSYHTTPLKLGDLQGNRFTIVLRDIQCQDESHVDAALSSLRDNGFINYFGMQRFGTHSIPTYVVGISILKGEWREAVEVIMQAKAEDNDRIAEARQVWSEKQDAKKALSLFPFRCIAERSIVQFFSKRGKTDDYMGALLAIPRNLRMLYVHSYQSLIFNAMATERLKMFGHKLVIGDLVEISADDAPIVPEEKHDTIKEDSGVHNDPSTADKEGEKENEPEEDTRSKMKVKVIQTEEDLARYTIYDMVLPLPGYDVMYPKHALFDEYKSLMKTHGFDPLDMKRKQKQFSLTGSYRKVVGQAKDLTWRKVRYDDSTVSLCRTDLEKSLGMPEVESIPEGKSLALVTEFTLDSSTYATIALREVLKNDSSSGHQTSLSKDSHA